MSQSYKNCDNKFIQGDLYRKEIGEREIGNKLIRTGFLKQAEVIIIIKKCLYCFVSKFNVKLNVLYLKELKK